MIVHVRSIVRISDVLYACTTSARQIQTAGTDRRNVVMITNVIDVWTLVHSAQIAPVDTVAKQTMYVLIQDAR